MRVSCPRFLLLGFILLGSNAIEAQLPASGIESPSTADIETLIRSKSYSEAEVALKKALATEPNSWRTQYQLGYVQFELHRFHESVAALCKSLSLNKGWADSHRILAYDLNVLGRQDLAISELQTTLKLDPASADAHYELGRIFFDQGAYAPALEQLMKARALTPGDVRVYHNLGLAYAALTRKEEAVAAFDEGLERNGREPHPSAWPLIDYASFRNNEGQFEQARLLAEQAVAVDRSSPAAYGELGKAYRGLGQTAAAIAALSQATALDPQKADYHYILARLYSKTNQKAAADAELSAYAQAQTLSSAHGR